LRLWIVELIGSKQMKLQIKNESGFTLIELLIASVLAGVVTFAALDVYLNQHQQFIIQEQVSDMQQRGRAVLDEIAFDLRQSGFGTPDSISAFTIGANNGGPDTLAINHHSNNITYYVDESDTANPNFMKDVNGTPQIFADDIEGFEVTSMGTNLVQISIVARTNKVDEKTGNDYRRRTYTMRVQLRNI